jgi:hypothetical protein
VTGAAVRPHSPFVITGPAASIVITVPAASLAITGLDPVILFEPPRPGKEPPTQGGVTGACLCPASRDRLVIPGLPL